jgi:uncharacterized membrane protein
VSTKLQVVVSDTDTGVERGAVLVSGVARNFFVGRGFNKFS